MKIKYRGKIYNIEFFSFDNPVKSMFITLEGINILAISSRLTHKEMSKELHILLNGKKLKRIGGVI